MKSNITVDETGSVFRLDIDDTVMAELSEQGIDVLTEVTQGIKNAVLQKDVNEG